MSRNLPTRVDIENLLKFKIRQEIFYQRALIHKSVNVPGIGNNENLEFLGDRAMDLAVAEWLFDNFPSVKDSSGVLTKAKISLVEKNQVSKYALHLKLNDILVMYNDRNKLNISIMENTFEALVGAIHKDLGYRAVKEFMHRILNELINRDELIQDTNYIHQLMEYHQKQPEKHIVEYVVLSEEGPGNRKEFTVQVEIAGTRYGIGTGLRKKDAQQVAAKATLDMLGINSRTIFDG